MREYLFTSESVTEGHPDKVCDRISDSVVDAVLAQDPRGRVACETATTTGQVFVCGEITFKGELDTMALVRRALREIGYTKAEYGIDAEYCGINVALHEQSPDIAQGVNPGGAGDQGLMFGYACRETPELMPLPIQLAHRLCKRLADVRKKGELDWLRPDGKSQVTVRYRDGKPVGVETVVLSTQHDPNIGRRALEEAVIETVINPVITQDLRMPRMKRPLINPTGRFVVGGPHGDSGLTGRKIIVDTYGGAAPHGGGAFSGKDPTKVDRSACYAARWIAKNVVAARLADKCQVQVAYAIGVAEPVSVYVQTFGTGKVEESAIERAVRDVFDLTPRGIIKELRLDRPIYTPTSSYGHFGRPEKTFTWESTNRAAELRREIK